MNGTASQRKLIDPRNSEYKLKYIPIYYSIYLGNEDGNNDWRLAEYKETRELPDRSALGKNCYSGQG